MGKVTERSRCPKCAEGGHDSKGDNLTHYDDGSAFCYACSYTVLSNGRTKMSYKLPANMPIPATGIASKGISATTCNRFGVVHIAATDSEGNALTKPAPEGQEGHVFVGSGVIAFPYYDVETGLPVAAKLRRFKKTGNEEKEMWWDSDGDKSKVTWFGTNAAPASATKVVLCEGESDTLSVAQAIPDVAVFGVSGADSVDRAVRGSLHVLKKFKHIILAFDNDEAGQRATQAAMKLLPPNKTMIVSMPSDVKDMNELLMDGKESEIRRLVRDAKQVTPKGVVDEDDFLARLLADIMDTDRKRGAATGFAALDAAVGGLVGGKMITVAGGTGCGKSYFAETIASNAAQIGGVKTFFIPLEMTDTQTGKRMVQQLTGLPICADPYFNPKPHIEQITLTSQFIKSHVKFLDNFGAIDIPRLLESCEFAIDAYGCQLIVLDHMTAAASGSDGLDWKALDAASSEIKRLALQKNVTIIVVSHISRDGDNEEEVPKLKHLRGGNGIAQYSDCVLGLGRKRDSDTMTVRTLKVDRMIGKFTEFDIKLDGLKLVEVGTPRDFIEEEAEEYEFTEGQENKRVQESVRGINSSTQPATGVRADKTGVRNDAQVHAGLENSGNEHLHREQRNYDSGGQGQVVAGALPVPRAGLEVTLTEPEFEVE